MTTPTFNRPDNLMQALQYNATTGQPELRVTLGSESITITGSVNVGTVVEVSSTPENPVHTHISEVGTSGVLAVPYMPSGIVDASGHINDNTHPVYVNVVNGTLAVTQSGSWNVGITGTPTVNIGTMPAVQVRNDINNPLTVQGTVIAAQGTTPWVVSNASTDITIADSTYEMNVARGLLPGQSVITRNGYNPDVSQNIEESIWVDGGIYPFGTWTSPSRLYLVSDSSADVDQTLFIEGLDANYDYQTEQITINGLTPVATVKSWIRIYSGTVVSSSNASANAGNVVFHITSASGTVVAQIAPGIGMTKLSQFTVPRNKTAYILYGDATSFRGGSGNIGSQIRMYVRPFGGSFIAAHISEVVNGYYRSDFTVPLTITEKSDIDVRCLADANNTVFTCNYQMILVDNA